MPDRGALAGSCARIGRYGPLVADAAYRLNDRSRLLALLIAWLCSPPPKYDCMKLKVFVIASYG
jgi:hypothetical protein